MRIGICTGLDKLEAAYEAGYAYVESGVATLLPDQDEAAFAPVRKQFLAAPIRVEAFNGFLPPTLKVTGPEVDLDAVARYMDAALRRASEVGAKIVVFGSGGARCAPEGFPIDQAWAQFDVAGRLAAETAERYDVTIALEPLLKRACNFFNRVEEGAAMVDRVNHPRLRLLTDLYHISAEEEPFENITKAGKRLVHTHLATPAIPETGEGIAYDFAGFFCALHAAGYDARTSVEDNPGLLGGKHNVEVYRAVREYVEQFLVK